MHENTNCYEYFKKRKDLEKALQENTMTVKEYEEALRLLGMQVDSRNHNTYN